VNGDEIDAAAILVRMIPNQVAGQQYPHPMPEELARWYCYLRECGHSIVVIPASRMPAGDPTVAQLEGQLVPIPPRTVLRLGYTIVSGFIVCPILYSPDLGAVVPSTEEEW